MPRSGKQNHNERLLRQTLTRGIARAIRDRRMTQQEAAKRMGVDQPSVSGLLNGKRHFTADRLVEFLTLLGCDVHVRISRTRGTRRGELLIENDAEPRYRNVTQLDADVVSPAKPTEML